jgi:hypothetical protein
MNPLVRIEPPLNRRKAERTVRDQGGRENKRVRNRSWPPIEEFPSNSKDMRSRDLTARTWIARTCTPDTTDYCRSGRRTVFGLAAPWFALCQPPLDRLCSACPARLPRNPMPTASEFDRDARAKWYARQHQLAHLAPALARAGGITGLVPVRHFGQQDRRHQRRRPGKVALGTRRIS